MKTYFIIPVYNVETYLQRCVDSIFSQTDEDFVVIFVNDGSKDNSLAILEGAAKQHKNMLIVNKENGGLSSARNAGLKVIDDIENSLISFVDSDDYLDKDFLKNTKAAMIKHKADVVCSLYRGLNPDGSYCSNKILKGNDKVLNRYEALKLLLSAKIKCHSPTKLYKGFLWKDTFFDEKISFLEDQYLTPCVFDKADVIVKTFYYGYFYQHHSASLCGSKMTPSKINDSVSSYIYLYNHSFSIENKENKRLRKIILNQFYEIYLMMYPRINRSEYNDEQLKQLEKINSFVKQHNILFNFRPYNFKNFMKKYLYIFSKKIYLKIYKRHLGAN